MKRLYSTKALSPGMTLIEVLISIGLLALLSGLTLQAMRLTFKARETITRIEELNHTAQVTLRRLVRDLSMAYLSNHMDARDPRTITLFQGDEQSVLFTYLGHERRRQGAKESDQGVVEYTLESSPSGMGQALVRREKSPLDDEPERGRTKEVLAEGVVEFDLKYWDDGTQEWKREWKVDMRDALKSGTGGELGPVLAPAGAQLMKAAQEKMLEKFELPSRVYIRLVLEDSKGTEYEFETQARIHLRFPLNF